MIVAVKSPVEAYVTITDLNRENRENYLNDDGSVASDLETRLIPNDNKVHLIAVLNYRKRSTGEEERVSNMIVTDVGSGEIIYNKAIELTERVIIERIPSS